MQQKSFIVYKSSAGSGKTYTLVKEYLKLVLPNPSRVKQILAITFTNAASAEMKDRIIKALAEIAALNRGHMNFEGKEAEAAESLIKQISTETHMDKSVLMKNSEKVLYYILHNYNEFNISTIDSFTHRILRTFAFDLHIPVNFEIEFDYRQVIQKAADILVSKAGEENNSELTNLLIQFIESRTDEERSFAIEREIVQMAEKMLNEDSIHFLEKLKEKNITDFVKAYAIINKKLNDFQKNISELANRGFSKIKENRISDSSMANGKNGIYSWFRKLSEGRIMDCLPPTKTVEKTVYENKWHSAKASAEGDLESISSIAFELEILAKEILTLSENGLGNFIFLNNIKNKLFSLALINEMEKAINDIRKEENILFISDFNKKISDVIAREPVPFIYERVGEKYQNYMIDEFQDTSVLQWQNMLPLVENSLAVGNISLVVGDAKQSIYRWRGGDAYQFMKLPKLTDKICSVNKNLVESTLSVNYKQIPEDPDSGTINYRSRETIVNFNNDFFETIKSHLPEFIREVYRGHQQQSLKTKTGGYVEISFIPEIKGEKALFQEETLKKIETIINETIAKNFFYNDIAILCRKKEEAAIITQYLTQQGIYVVSDESLLLNSSPKVNFLISFLKYINDPSDSIAITEIINFLITEKLIKHPENLNECLEEIFTNQNNPVFERFQELLNKNGVVLPSILFSASTVYEILQELERMFLSSHQKIDPYVTFFFDSVYEYQQKNQSTLSGFLQYWDENNKRLSLVVPDKLNAVKVLTIHKSKGLQFPVVIYPFAREAVKWHADDGFWINVNKEDFSGIEAAYIGARKDLLNTNIADIYKEEEDNKILDLINLTYVAFTRPQDKLFIISSIPVGGNFPKNSLNKFLHEYLNDKGLWKGDNMVYSFPENFVDDNQISNIKVEAHNSYVKDLLKYHMNRPWKDIVTAKIYEHPQEAGEVSKRITRGKVIHKAMENIFESKDVPIVMKQLLTDGFINQNEKATIERKISELIENPIVSPFFSNEYEIKTEPGIFDENGNFYRPDRIAFSPNKTMVIDYKTGRQDKKHHTQVRRYGKLLDEMGYKNLKLCLAYIDIGIVEEVGI